MISKADAISIIYHLDPARLARLTFRAAVHCLAREVDERRAATFRLVAAVLDLRDGALRIQSFHAEASRGVEMDENLVVIAYADRVLVEDTERRISAGCTLPPSAEVIAEEVARAVEDDGVGVSWRAVETQLRLTYEAADREPPYPPERETRRGCTGRAA